MWAVFPNLVLDNVWLNMDRSNSRCGQVERWTTSPPSSLPFYSQGFHIATLRNFILYLWNGIVNTNPILQNIFPNFHSIDHNRFSNHFVAFSRLNKSMSYFRKNITSLYLLLLVCHCFWGSRVLFLESTTAQKPTSTHSERMLSHVSLCNYWHFRIANRICRCMWTLYLFLVPKHKARRAYIHLNDIVMVMIHDTSDTFLLQYFLFCFHPSSLL